MTPCKESQATTNCRAFTSVSNPLDKNSQNDSQIFGQYSGQPSKSKLIGSLTFSSPASFPSLWLHQIGLAFYNLLKVSKFRARRCYEVFWHELSMDPRVRLSPWSEPVENQKKLATFEIFYLRFLRVYCVFGHLILLRYLYGSVLGEVKIATILWTLSSTTAAGISITAGIHRLWCHNSYKAKWPARLLFGIIFSSTAQYSILNWAKDHRVHHKYSDTDADPHNARRGFFFSHFGWLVTTPHPDVVKRKNEVYSKDLENDWIVRYQHKYYKPLAFLFCYLIPTMVPSYFWGEDLWIAHTAFISRHVVLTNMTASVNSVAHLWGTKPYDKNILPCDNKFIACLTYGEGWHNYHHVYPWDYKASEFGNYKLNVTKALIDFLAWIGLAYDLKTVPASVVTKRVVKTRGSSYPDHHEHGGIWGWNDEEMSEKEKNSVLRTYEKQS